MSYKDRTVTDAGTGRSRGGRSRGRRSEAYPSEKRNSGTGHDRRKNFVIQGSLLAAAGILVRLIGMIYRVPLTAIIGTEGNGYYTSAFSIYSLLLILSSYSMPTAISRIVSRNTAKERYRDTGRLLQVAFFYATMVGLLMGSLLWFGAEGIAALLQKPYCSFALKALAPTVWIMAYLGILRGYFQGSGNMVPTAISQIIEQILNAIISVLAAYILFHQGETANILYQETEYSYAFGAAGGAMGTGAGALAALLFFILLYLSQRQAFLRKVRRDKGETASYGAITMILGATMLPILLSSTVYNISSVIDDYLFGNIMTQMGRAKEIVSEWGVFGEYHILFNIPVALANALSSSLIPSLTRAVEAHDRRNTVSRARYSIRFTMLIAIPSAMGLCVLAEPMCEMLFPGKSVELLISLTRVGAMAVVFYSLSTITNAILQGLGHLQLPLRNALISLVLHIIVLVAFLYSGMGIYAVVLANIVFALLMCLLNQLSIQKHLRFEIGVVKGILYPIFASFLMGGCAYGCYRLLRMVLSEAAEGRIGAAITLLPSVFVGIVVYFAVLFIMRAFTEEDLDNMPFGGRLKRFLW